MSAIDDICAYADRKLSGSPLTFALVVWVKGEEGNPASVALSANPKFQGAPAIQARRSRDPSPSHPRPTTHGKPDRQSLRATGLKSPPNSLKVKTPQTILRRIGRDPVPS